MKAGSAVNIAAAGPPTCRARWVSEVTMATSRWVWAASSRNRAFVSFQKVRSGSFHTSNTRAGWGAVAILPTTNPTSTAIYKILISLKACNAIVLSPHPRAVRCTCATADLLYRAALEAGAPEDIVQCLGYASLDGTNALMRHERTGVILS